MTIREPVRRYVYPDAALRDRQLRWVSAAAHDKLVGELMRRIAVLENAVCNEVPKLERLESWLQIQCVASPSSKTVALRDAAQYSLRDLRNALEPKDHTQ